MGVGDRADGQQGLGARWGTSPQAEEEEAMRHQWRVGRGECDCRGEGSRVLVELVLYRSRDKQETLAGSQRRWPGVGELAAGAATALASVA